MSWLAGNPHSGLFNDTQKKANSLKPSGERFKTQCASLLGEREPTAETKREETILSLEAAQ